MNEQTLPPLNDKFVTLRIRTPHHTIGARTTLEPLNAEMAEQERANIEGQIKHGHDLVLYPTVGQKGNATIFISSDLIRQSIVEVSMF